MADLMPLALEFARAFNKAVRSFRMYSPAHPQVAHDCSDAFAWLEKMTATESPVTFGARENVLIVQGRPVREMTPVLKAFVDGLASRGIASFAAQKGASLQEFNALVDLLVKKPDEILTGDRIRPELIAPLRNLRVNELRFVALEDGASEAAVKALSAGGQKQQDLLRIVEAFVSGSAGDVGSISRRIEAFSRQGNPGDFVGMIDSMTRQLAASGIDPGEQGRKMSQLFKLLPVAEEVQALRRVLVMQEDLPTLEQWSTALKYAGFDVERASSPPAAVARIREGGRYSGIVADAGFRGPQGVKFLDDIAQASPSPIPMVLLSWDDNLRQSPSVAKYPMLRFLPQPVEPPVLTETLEEIALPPDVRRYTEQEVLRDPNLARELERAQKIQASLLPSSLPQVDGFEIAAAYQPATVVGGDYYDVLQLPDGRMGLIVADVSGKGVSAAMIMVMARTVFHTVAAQHAGPRDTVLAAADRLVPDLPGGIFLTLIYALLDPASSTLTCVSCGHNPPLLWTRFQDMNLVETVDVSGGALGLVRGETFKRSLRECQVHLDSGEQVVLYTDGVTEAMNPENEEFGEKGLFRAMKRAGGKAALQMAEEILGAVDHHRNGASASDDLTVLVVRRD